MNEKINTPVKKLAFTGLFIALVFVMTIIIRIPSPTGGYINIGDCAVLAAGIILGPVYGALAAGIGSAVCDIVAGVAIYAPGTLIIKALMAMLAGLMYKKCKSNAKLVALLLVCELIMIVGYFFYSALILHLTGGENVFAASLEEVVGNLLQGAIGIIGAIMLKRLFEDILTKMSKEE
ncbi:MAG: ECF transporter S component [Lachnospiraceae bacterium]|nr:ECF transporter S component [Lachnospiraceae bacterium]